MAAALARAISPSTSQRRSPSAPEACAPGSRCHPAACRLSLAGRSLSAFRRRIGRDRDGRHRLHSSVLDGALLRRDPGGCGCSIFCGTSGFDGAERVSFSLRFESGSSRCLGAVPATRDSIQRRHRDRYGFGRCGAQRAAALRFAWPDRFRDSGRRSRRRCNHNARRAAAQGRPTKAPYGRRRPRSSQ